MLGDSAGGNLVINTSYRANRGTLTSGAGVAARGTDDGDRAVAVDRLDGLFQQGRHARGLDDVGHAGAAGQVAQGGRQVDAGAVAGH